MLKRNTKTNRHVALLERVRKCVPQSMLNYDKNLAADIDAVITGKDNVPWMGGKAMLIEDICTLCERKGWTPRQQLKVCALLRKFSHPPVATLEAVRAGDCVQGARVYFASDIDALLARLVVPVVRLGASDM